MTLHRLKGLYYLIEGQRVLRSEFFKFPPGEEPIFKSISNCSLTIHPRWIEINRTDANEDIECLIQVPRPEINEITEIFCDWEPFNTNDAVDHPLHYGGDTPYEAIKVIEAWGLDEDFYLGNTVKYISRAGKKDPTRILEDLEKALWYLQRKVNRLRSKNETLTSRT